MNDYLLGVMFVIVLIAVGMGFGFFAYVLYETRKTRKMLRRKGKRENFYVKRTPQQGAMRKSTRREDFPITLEDIR